MLLLFLNGSGKNCELTPLGEKVIMVWGFSFLIGLVTYFIGYLLGLSEVVRGCMPGIPMGIGTIVSIVMLEKGGLEDGKK